MNSVIDSLPADLRDVFVEVLKARNPRLLQSLRADREPSRDERVQVMRTLSTEFARHLQPDWEPTPRGVDIDNALGAFLLQWPIERQDDS